MTDAHDYTRCISQDCPERERCQRWTEYPYDIVEDSGFVSTVKDWDWVSVDEGRVVCAGLLV